MIIQSISLTGFNADTKLINAQNSSSMVSLAGEQKNYFFESILAILFGMTEPEMEKFRNQTGVVKTFTGRLTLKFDTFSLYIERDFFTNIIAVLSESEKGMKSVYQGKDVPGHADHNAYQELLESVFTITDKATLRRLCREPLASKNALLGDVLEIFYIYMRPKYAIAYLERIIQRSKNTLKNYKDIPPNSKDTLHLHTKLNLLKNLRLLSKGQNQIARDLESMGGIKQETSENSATVLIKQKYPSLCHLDADTVTRDIELYTKFQSQYKQIRETINKLLNRKKALTGMLNEKYIAYTNLPDTFEEDFHTYQELTLDLADERNAYDRFNLRIRDKQDEINRIKKARMITLVSLPVVFILTLIALPDYMFGLVTGGAATVGGVALFFKFMLDARKREMEFFHEKQFRIRSRIKEIDEQIYALREKSFLLDDLRLIDTHIDNFHECKKIQAQIKELDKELRRFQNAGARIPSDEIDRIENTYRDKLDLSRPDLLAYVKQFAKLQKQARQQGGPKGPDPIAQVKENYSRLLIQIEETRQQIIARVHPPEENNALENTIKSLERFIRHTQLENLN